MRFKSNHPPFSYEGIFSNQKYVICSSDGDGWVKVNRHYSWNELEKLWDKIEYGIRKTIQKTEVKKEITEPEKHKSGYASYFSKIDTGRKTLCFFVPGCDHCRVAAKELTELKQKDKNFPEISIIFMNEEADLIPDFFKYAGAEYPYKIIEVIPFWKVLGSGKDTPGVKYLWNGNEYKYYFGITDNKFDPVDYQKLINKPFSELKK